MSFPSPGRELNAQQPLGPRTLEIYPRRLTEICRGVSRIWAFTFSEKGSHWTVLSTKARDLTCSLTGTLPPLRDVEGGARDARIQTGDHSGQTTGQLAAAVEVRRGQTR